MRNPRRPSPPALAARATAATRGRPARRKDTCSAPNCTKPGIDRGCPMRPSWRVSDVVADNGLTPEQRAERGSYVGCIAGALSFGEYEDGLRSTGFTDVSVISTHQVAQGMHSAIIKAVKGNADRKADHRAELPLIQ